MMTYSNVVNWGLCGVFSGSAYGMASGVVDGRSISVFTDCNGVFIGGVFTFPIR